MGNPVVDRLRSARDWIGKRSTWEVAAAVVTVLGFIGGGVGLFWPSKETPPTVTATNGVAIGGNVTNSAVINIAGIEKLPQDQIEAVIRGFCVGTTPRRASGSRICRIEPA